MGNLFLPVVAPAADGSGAAVDFSGFGSEKTIIVSGSWGNLPTVSIEINNDPVSTNGGWQSIGTFVGAGVKIVNVACRWIRATVSGFRGGMAPVVNIGGSDDGTDFAQLVAPAGDGSGAAVDTSALGLFKTAHVAGAFSGALAIDVSEDGGTTWGEAFTFLYGGARSVVIAADFMRVRRSGVPGVAPGLPVINIGACTIGAPPAPSSLNQVFQYTVTGLEPDKANLVIALPATRADANYEVFVQQQTCTAQLASNVTDATKTINQFVLNLGAAAVANDVFAFTVADRT